MKCEISDVLRFPYSFTLYADTYYWNLCFYSRFLYKGGFFIELTSPGNIDFSILSSCFAFQSKKAARKAGFVQEDVDWLMDKVNTTHTRTANLVEELTNLPPSGEGCYLIYYFVIGLWNWYNS